LKLEDFVEGQRYEYTDIATAAGYAPQPGGNFGRGIVLAPRYVPAVITIKINRAKGLYSDTYREGTRVFDYIGDGLPEEGDQKLRLGNRIMFRQRDLPVMFFLRKVGESKQDPWWFKGIWRIASCKRAEDPEKIKPDGEYQKVFRFSLRWVAPSLDRLPLWSERRAKTGFFWPRALEGTDYIRVTREALQVILPRHRRLADGFWDWLTARGFQDVELETDRVDVRFRSAEDRYMAELKVVYGTTSTKSLREAMGQVLEYNYYENRGPFDKWLVVLDKEPREHDQNYISRLESDLGLPLNMGWHTSDGFRFVHPFEST